MEQFRFTADVGTMQTIPWLMSGGADAGAEAPVEPLRVAVFYSDFLAGSATLRVFSRLLDSLDDEFLVQLSVWRLDDCLDQQRLQQGATAAALADVVLLGLWAGCSLPFTQRRWIREVMLRRAGRPGLLIRVQVPGPDVAGRVSRRRQSDRFAWLGTPALSGAPLAPRSGCGDAERREKIARGLALVFGEPERSPARPD